MKDFLHFTLAEGKGNIFAVDDYLALNAVEIDNERNFLFGAIIDEEDTIECIINFIKTLVLSKPAIIMFGFNNHVDTETLKVIERLLIDYGFKDLESYEDRLAFGMFTFANLY